jgi:hypothetical protein
MEVPVCGEIKSRADFRRVLGDVIRFTSGKIGDGRFVDRRWLRIDKELNAIRLSTLDGHIPTEAERQNIDIARFAKSRIMGQGDWNDYVKCLVGLNAYFKAWPPDEPVSVSDVAQTPKTLPKAVPKAAAPHVKQTTWHAFWRWVEDNTRLAASIPLIVAYGIYWVAHRIAPSSAWETWAIALFLLSGVWGIGLGIYAMFWLARLPFRRCPRCHQRFGFGFKCRSCGVKSARP